MHKVLVIFLSLLFFFTTFRKILRHNSTDHTLYFLYNLYYNNKCRLCMTQYRPQKGADDHMNSDFPRIIALQRKERQISQKQAAADLGISQALLSHYEKGIRECGLDFLVKIADYYGVSCDYLLGRTPEPEGRTISIEDIPDDDGNNSMPSPEVVAFNRKIINNSISMLFSLAQKANSITLIKEISSYLMLNVYKLFRIVYNANPRNDQKLFSVPKVVANDDASAIVSMNEANIKAASSGIPIGDNDYVKDPDVLYLTTAILSQTYPEYSSSLLNLVKISEDSIHKKRNA